jgi:hypothetical protein
MSRWSSNETSRREFLARAGVASCLALAGTWPKARLAAQEQPPPAPAAVPRPKVAAVVTEFTYRSHAHVILENFLKPYLFNGEWTDPGCDVVSMYVDQFPETEMARGVSTDFKIPIFDTIDKALCLGGDKLAVDAVLSIGEHGDYPENNKWQRMYPRKRFFDEIVAVFRRSERSVPVFNDKHLSYRWDWAKEMYDTAQTMGFGLMAGSSVPLAERRPPLELAPGVELTDAISIHGGGVESYDIHALEVLQSMVEARKGAEGGVAAVQFLEGDALWKAAADGVWSTELATAAMAAELGPDDPLTKAVTNQGKTPDGQVVPMHGIAVWYKDGFHATALKVADSGTRWNFAARDKANPAPLATAFYVGPWQNRNLFKALSHAIQVFFREGKSPYPVERTLLTTGILDAAMDSRLAGGMRIETPQLAIAYEPRDFRAMREMGASWKIITETDPEPPGIDPGGKPAG